MRSGLAIGGNAIVDEVKLLDAFPGPGMLATIESITHSTGGALCNVLMDINKLSPEIPLTAVGVVGADDNGERIMRALKTADGADLSLIRRAGETSFTDVMTYGSTRTFFHSRGSNALLSPADFDFDKINARMLYVGYVLLLDGLDAPDEECGTQMARLLRDARAAGIETCIDVVSEESDRFRSIAMPALKYTDYLIINEVEAERITGVKLREGDQLNARAMPEATRELFKLGVGKWAVIHAPEGAFAQTKQGEFAQVGGAILPKGFIKGSVGAGDAFLSGVLATAYNGGDITSALEAGIAAAITSLTMPGSTEGVLPLPEALKLLAQMPRREL